jgi:hypothetical protein
MRYLLGRNKVKDYGNWRRVFDSHKDLHAEAGLQLLHLWRSSADRNDVYFLFEMADEEKAREFVNSPENPRIARTAGVVDGEIRYLDELEGY